MEPEPDPDRKAVIPGDPIPGIMTPNQALGPTSLGSIHRSCNTLLHLSIEFHQYSDRSRDG
jgi:hypothetical protein